MAWLKGSICSLKDLEKRLSDGVFIDAFHLIGHKLFTFQ